MKITRKNFLTIVASVAAGVATGSALSACSDGEDDDDNNSSSSSGS